MMENNPNGFMTTLPVWVFCRPRQPASGARVDWRELDQGPGIIRLPAGEEASLRIKNLDDDLLRRLVSEIQGCAAITGLNLSENRGITNQGLAYLVHLPQLTYLSLSACSLTNRGVTHLLALSSLQYLDLSYCNRLTNDGVKQLKALRSLTYLDLQGCVKVNNSSLSKMRRDGLSIHHRTVV
jgi:Leucine-rich repeat (LRR) protein